MMKKTWLLLIPLCSIAILSKADEFPDVVEAPYFKVSGEDMEKVQLPLLGTYVDVDIAGVIADVNIEQVYVNSGSIPIEAVYVFPGSSKSAVYQMKMQINERTIEAKITEKKEAKQKYEKAKQEGKSATMLKQHRPNVFQMNVANILPGDTIRVDFSYTELLVPEESTYEFVFPTAVGPRYADSAGVVKDPWVTNPYAQTGKAGDPETQKRFNTRHEFDISTNVNTGMPVHELMSPSHEVDIQFAGPSTAKVDLKGNHQITEPKDFIIRYKLTGDKISTGLLLYEGEEENFFLYMAQPPKRVEPEAIPPREYIFIVDVSGSMRGFPIEISKKLLRDLIGGLKPTDKFNVMLFASASAVLSPTSLDANEKNIREAINFIDKEGGSGSTQLLPALQRALRLPGVEDMSRTVVIATDGYVTVEREAFDLISENLGKANFFAFGIGPGVNRYIIEGMAHAGHGEPVVVTHPKEAKQQARKFANYIKNPVLTNIALEFEGFKAYDISPKSYPDLFAEKPVVVFGKWKGDLAGTITLTGKTGAGPYRKPLRVNAFEADETNDALRYLWARNRIMLLSDYNRLAATDEALKAEITALGLQYSLLTEYTAFLGIDSEVRVPQKTHSSSGAVPEPHEWLLIFLLGSMGIFLIYRRYRDGSFTC